MGGADLFFISSNTDDDSYTMTEELYNPFDNWKLFILSGESESIKSNIIYKTAVELNKLGCKTELILNSNNVNRYEAAIIKNIKVSVVSEHSKNKIHSFFPGLCEEIIDVNIAADRNHINTDSDNLDKLYLKRGEYNKKLTNYISAEKIIDEEIKIIISKYINLEKTDRYIKRFLSSINCNSTNGAVKNRILSSLTADGLYINYKSFYNQCDKIIMLKDNYSVVSNIIIRALAEYASVNNIESTVFRCSLNPQNKFDHIIFSESRTGIFTSNIFHPIIFKTSSSVNTDRFIDKGCLRDNGNKLRFLKKAKIEFIEESVKILKNIKLTDDTIDRIYTECSKKESVDIIQKELLKKIRERIQS